jgi:hypothetical protein
MRSIRRSNIDLPVHAINANIIFARGRASAVFRVPTKSFEFLSLAEKHALHGQLAWWMIKVEADFSIYRVCREYPVDEYERDASGLLDERFADRGAWEQLVRSHTEHMRSMRSFTPEVYFVVSLQPPRRAPWSRVSRDLSVLRDAEQSVFDMLHEHLSDARRASTLELQWLMRRAGVRGVCEPDTDPNWSPPAMTLDGGVWEAGRADVQSFMSAVTENRRTVLAEGEDGESLQAMLMLGKPPKQAEYPGAAELLFAPLESLDFPVDAVLHARWIPNKKMLSIADNSIKDAHDEVLDASARFLDQKTRRRALEVDSVQDYFASEPYPPGLETFISLAVGVPTSQPDLLKQRVKRLRRAYGSVKLYQPYALQSDLYGDHLLRPDGSSPSEYRRDYKRLLIVEQVSAMMPIGANQGGSDSGIYFGYTIPGTCRPVKHDLLEAFRLNRTGAILLNGSLGSGKTIAVQLLAYLAARRGSLVVDIDPKKPVPDHSLERWPGLEDRTHEILISNSDNHRGQLDPLIVALPDMREELATSYMMDILPQATPEWQTEIIDSVRAVLRDSRPSSMRVVERLLASDDSHARAAGKALRVWSDWGLAKCAFSHGEQYDLDAHMPVTMIKAPALTLPLAGTARASYDQSERVSVATFKLIIARALRLLSGRDRTVHKFLVIDEAHVLTTTADGRRFLEMVIRMGRYMNITVVLASQLAGDLAELEQLIGIRFAFRQETDEQASINLRMNGLDGDDRQLIKMLRGFSDGRCLMRGLDGRVIPMRFDVVDPEILRIADTNPTRALAALEDAFVA